MYIHITNKCNLDCIYCYSLKDKKCLSTEKIYRLITEAKNNGIERIGFLGGEPLLNPHIFAFLKKCLKNRIIPTLYTNGAWIDQNTIKKLTPFRKKLILAFNFDHPLTYKQHKSKDFYQKVYKNIDACKKQGFQVYLFITLTKINLSFFKETSLIAKKLEAKIMVEKYLPVKNNTINKKLELNNKEWHSALKLFSTVHKKQFLRERIHKRLTGNNCSCYNEFCFVMPDGDVLPCAFAPKYFKIGNVHKESLKSIFGKYMKLRKKWNRVPKECKGCEKSDYCRGGCKTYRYLKHQSLSKKEPFCCKTYNFY